jgi:hypothetical protein
MAYVYDPHWIPGLSLSSDLWRVYLNNEISRVTAQERADPVLSAERRSDLRSDPSHRRASVNGQISFVQEPKGNLGRLDAKGVDFWRSLPLPETGIGNFAVNFQTTYLDRYADDPAPGQPGDFLQEYAGHYSTGARPSPTRTSRAGKPSVVELEPGSVERGVDGTYVGNYTVGYAARTTASRLASRTTPGCELQYGASVYHNITAGYNIEPLNTRVDVGIDNLSDKAPAIIYQNNTLNGNV